LGVEEYQNQIPAVVAERKRKHVLSSKATAGKTAHTIFAVGDASHNHETQTLIHHACRP
jgi:hypothetical protein